MFTMQGSSLELEEQAAITQGTTDNASNKKAKITLPVLVFISISPPIIDFYPDYNRNVFLKISYMLAWSNSFK
jgi:hypothetical protein